MAPPERVSLASYQSAVSPFARMAQASNLLGRVIRHCNDAMLELDFVLDEFETLSNTTVSLMELLIVDSPTSIDGSVNCEQYLLQVRFPLPKSTLNCSNSFQCLVETLWSPFMRHVQ